MHPKAPIQEFNGKRFKISQPSGSCCESGCDGCELFIYKLENGLPLKNSRTNYYEKLKKKLDP
jgi:hypothetical protein